MPTMQIPAKLEPFLTRPKRFKIAYGGRGAGKSCAFADAFLMLSQTEQAKIGCLREYQNSIEDSVHALLSSEIRRLGCEGFQINKTEIENSVGGKFRFKGLSRSIDGVKSFSGFDYFWIEEAQFISRESLEILTPSLRSIGGKKSGELWFSMNPGSSSDPISQRFLVPFQAELDRNGYYEDDQHIIIKMNYDDNPWFPAELDAERKLDLKRLPRAEYDHKWLGAYNDHVDNSIILAEWFDAAIDAHKKLHWPAPVGAKILAFDPADSGDAKALAVRHGSIIQKCTEITHGDVGDATDWAITTALENNIDAFIWDTCGLGLPLSRPIEKGFEGKKIDVYKFNGAETPDNPDQIYISDFMQGRNKTHKQLWKNRRAQYYGLLRDRFFLTYQAVEKGIYADPDKMISISSDIQYLPKLRSEICRIARKFTTTGIFQLEEKSKMAESPNMADVVSMAAGLQPVPVAASRVQFRPRRKAV